MGRLLCCGGLCILRKIFCIKKGKYTDKVQRNRTFEISDVRFQCRFDNFHQIQSQVYKITRICRVLCGWVYPMSVSLALALVLKLGSLFLAVFNLIRHAHIMPA